MTAIWLWLVGKLGGVWIWVAVAGVAITAIVGFGAYEHNAGYNAGVTASLPKIAVAQHERDIAYTALADYGRKVAEDAARANAAALTQKEAQDALAGKLRADLAKTEKARVAASAALVKALTDAAPKDVSPISPAVRSYLDSVRVAASSTGTSATPGNP